MKNTNRLLLKEGGQRRQNQFNTISTKDQYHTNTYTKTNATQTQWKTNRLSLRKGGQRRQNRLITSSLRALLTLRCPLAELAVQLAIISEKLENNLQFAKGGDDGDDQTMDIGWRCLQEMMMPKTSNTLSITTNWFARKYDRATTSQLLLFSFFLNNNKVLYIVTEDYYVYLCIIVYCYCIYRLCIHSTHLINAPPWTQIMLT